MCGLQPAAPHMFAMVLLHSRLSEQLCGQLRSLSSGTRGDASPDAAVQVPNSGDRLCLVNGRVHRRLVAYQMRMRSSSGASFAAASRDGHELPTARALVNAVRSRKRYRSLQSASAQLKANSPPNPKTEASKSLQHCYQKRH